MTLEGISIIITVHIGASGSKADRRLYLGLIQELYRNPNAPHSAKMPCVEGTTARRGSGG